MKPCTQCGRCCTNPGFMGSMQATADDLEMWRTAGRWDVLEWCWVIDDDVGGDLWISPVTGIEASRCPFVRKRRGQDKYDCTIYDVRPEVCRNYPLAIGHMQSIGCEMLEPGDTDEDVARFTSKQFPR